MKNVTKILTVVVLCAAMFASTQRTDALGGSQFWPGDESNIANFPAQANNHSFVQVNGVGSQTGVAVDANGDDVADDPLTLDVDESAVIDGGDASILFQKDGTTWGFNYGSDDWINMTWGDGDQAVSFGLANYSNNLTGDCADADDVTCLRENTGYKVSYGNTFNFGELGIHYEDSGEDGADAVMDLYMKSDFGFWIFDDTYVGAEDLTGDMKIRADFFSHRDAGGADVVYGWGIDMDMSDEGFMKQTATLGVEANMTDWATLRAGYTWNHTLSADDTPMVGSAEQAATANDSEINVAADGCTNGGTSVLGDWTDCDNAFGGASASTDYAAAEIAATGESIGTFAWGLGFNWGGLTADFTVSSTLLQDPVGTITGNNHDGGALTDHGLTLTYSF